MKRLAILFLALVLCASASLSQDLLNKGKVALGARDTTTAVQAFKEAVKANQKPSDANSLPNSIAGCGKARRFMSSAIMTESGSGLRKSGRSWDSMKRLTRAANGRKPFEHDLSHRGLRHIWVHSAAVSFAKRPK